MHQNMKCIRKENKKIDKQKKPKTLLLNKQNIKMTSLKISGEAKLQLVFCNQSQQLTVVPRLLQLSLTVATCLLQQPPLSFKKSWIFVVYTDNEFPVGLCFI